MDEKICPLRKIAPSVTDTDRTDTCIRKRCAWWCGPYGCTTGSGDCAITVIGMITLTNDEKQTGVR